MSCMALAKSSALPVKYLLSFSLEVFRRAVLGAERRQWRHPAKEAMAPPCSNAIR